MANKKIKLFVDAHVFDGVQQGTVSFIANLYANIIFENKFILYIGSKDLLKAQQLLKSNNFIHIKYKSNSKYIRLLFEIPYLLFKNKIDYAHFQYITPLIKPCKYILTLHDLLFVDQPLFFPLKFRFKNYFLFYLSSLQSDIITTVSSYSKKSILKNFKLLKKDIHIIPNIIDFDLLPGEIIKNLENNKFILYVSRIEPRKNHADLLKIWLQLELHKKGISLVFVGHNTINDPKLLDTFEKMNNDEKKYFHILGNVNANKLAWLYKNCMIFVFPSLAEGFGIPPLEASIYGAKVLTSNTTAMKDFDFFPLRFNPYDYNDFISNFKISITENYNIDLVNSEIQKRFSKSFITQKFTDIINNHFNDSF